MRGAPRRPRGAARAPPRRPGGGLGRCAPRRLGDALHGADDRHGAAAELPHAPRDRLPARRRPGRAPARGRSARARGGSRPGARLRPRRLELVARHPRLRRDGGGARPRGPAAEARLGPGLRLGPGPRRGAAPRRADDRRVGREGGDGLERGDRAAAPLALGGGTLEPGPRPARPRRPAGAPRRGRQGARRRFRRPSWRSSRRASSSPWPPAAARGARCPSWGGPRALAGAFWLSRRTGPDDLRYLYGLHAPLLALAGAGLAALWAWRRAAGVAAGLALLLPWGYGRAGPGRDVARSPPRRARLGGAVPGGVRCARCGRAGPAAPTRASSSPAASRSRPERT